VSKKISEFGLHTVQEKKKEEKKEKKEIQG
jgi:hypothetical protein